MHEQSKAVKRRYYDGAFLSRYFVGHGIDVGGAPDPLGQYCGFFPLLSSVRTWDRADGDGQYLASVADNTYDFLTSSHCLEHMVDPYIALEHWIRVVKPGGYIVVTIPDEDLYERGHWPSRYNHDHKWTFTIHKPSSWSPVSVNVTDLLSRFSAQVSAQRVVLQNDFFSPANNTDQTMNPVAECAIEFVLRKHPQ